LNAETSTASITLSLTSPPRVVTHHHHKAATKHHDSGFLAGLNGGWHAFLTGAKAVATAAGAVLPFAVLLLVLGLGARVLWPRLRPTRAPAPAPAPPQ
jgi:glycerol-3-phosphate acyltransferase PlsY